MIILDYLLSVLCWTGLLLWSMLGPFLLTAFLMQWFSNMLRSGFVKLFGLNAFVYFLAPGVMLHELGHAIFCFPFRHRVVEMKLFSPQRDGTLGWVNHTYDPNSYWANIGNFFIGTGPVWLGLFALYAVTYLLLPVGRFDMRGLSIYEASTGFVTEVIFHEEAFGWKWFVWAYLAFAIGANTTLSPPDIKGAFTGFCFTAICVLMVCLVSGWYNSWPAHAAEAIQTFTGSFFTPVLTILAIIGFVSFIFWCVASFLGTMKRRR
ncbi:MAG: hypothetical protein IJS15_12160 [Victivallales bacterium]|nr:hypothetical protein [Victivallales bacterium]